MRAKNIIAGPGVIALTCPSKSSMEGWRLPACPPFFRPQTAASRPSFAFGFADGRERLQPARFADRNPS